jgi:hypothetical protein
MKPFLLAPLLALGVIGCDNVGTHMMEGQVTRTAASKSECIVYFRVTGGKSDAWRDKTGEYRGRIVTVSPKGEMEPYSSTRRSLTRACKGLRSGDPIPVKTVDGGYPMIDWRNV